MEDVAKSTVGLRYDADKPRMDLIDPIAMEGLSIVLAVGAKKYADHNWAKGMKWSRVLGSLLRHTYKFMRGEDLDAESGLPHVDHILCNAMFLSNYYRQQKSYDDRFKQEKETVKEETKVTERLQISTYGGAIYTLATPERPEYSRVITQSSY
jgi:hypothetical protein